MTPQQQEMCETFLAAFRLLPPYVRDYILKMEEGREPQLLPDQATDPHQWLLNFPDPPGYVESLPEEQPQPSSSLPDDAEIPRHYPGGKLPSYASRVVPTPHAQQCVGWEVPPHRQLDDEPK